MITDEIAEPPMIITLVVLTATIRYTILVIMCNQVVVGHMSIALVLHMNTMAEAFHHRMAEVNMAALKDADN
jgi:hypothetical protein